MRKVQLARLMTDSKAVDALLRVRRMAPFPLLTVLTYHRVAAWEGSSPVDQDITDATPEQFERQIAFLAQQFQFVGIDDLDAFARGAPLPDNPVLVTFDDGYLECHSVVLPILRRHGARATFFVSTSYLERGRMFWWDFIGQVVRRCREERVELRYPQLLRLDFAHDRESASRTLLQLVKRHPGLDLERFLGQLLDATRVAWSAEEERELADRLLMRWPHVAELLAAGMDVQSHTRTHRVLQTLSPSHLRDELEGSRRELEERLGRPVSAIAYPVGYPLAHLDHLRHALRVSGYRWGFTNQSGVNRLWWPGDPYDLRRIAMTVEFDDRFFRAMMALPYLAPLRRDLRIRESAEE